MSEMQDSIRPIVKQGLVYRTIRGKVIPIGVNLKWQLEKIECPYCVFPRFSLLEHHVHCLNPEATMIVCASHHKKIHDDETHPLNPDSPNRIQFNLLI